MAASADATGTDGLKRRVVNASVWTIGGHAYDRLTHFASNLILTRILFPEAFGLMAIVNAVVQGIGLLSDVGIGASIVQNPRGEEREFQRTAWTLQVARGVLLFVVAAAGAWPAARLYDEPMLSSLIPVAALGSLVAGFHSPALFLWRRRLELHKLVSLEACASTLNVVTTVALAWWWQSVWALAVGGLAGTSLKLLVGHLSGAAHPMRFHWDAQASRSIYRFGRWIFLATALGYFTNQGDRLILGAMVSMADLGQYAIASLILNAIVQTYHLLARKVLFPLYVEVGQESGPELRHRAGRIRMALMALMLPPLWALAVFGQPVIDLLYDERYAGAGWMLEWLAAGAVFLVVGAIGPIQLARGESWINLLATGLRSAVLLVGMLIGGRIAGTPGLVAAVALSYVVHYPLQVWIARRYEVWHPALDGIGILVTLLVIGAGRYWL